MFSETEVPALNAVELQEFLTAEQKVFFFTGFEMVVEFYIEYPVN